MKILLIEDDVKLTELMKEHLRKFDFEVMIPKSFENIMAAFEQIQPQMVLLDINLPYFDGFYWCQKLRAVTKIPIIFISARDSNMDQVMALEYGADDYLVKPFSHDILVAKIRSQARRVYGDYAPKNQARVLEANGLSFYPESLRLCYQGREEFLTVREAELMGLLLKAYPKMVRREVILTKLWDDERFVDDNTVSVNVGRIRKKLQELGLQDAIQTIRGKGYLLAVGESS